MSDVHTPDQRHRNMAAIRGKDTKPEMIVRRYLWSHGFRYRLNHPRKHLIQRDKPDLFRVRRNKTSANWTPERIMQGLCADRFIAADRSRQVEAWQQITTKGIRNSRSKVSATLKFKDAHPIIELVGNMELLKRPLYPLVCHRADAHLYEQQKEAVLKVTGDGGGPRHQSRDVYGDERTGASNSQEG